MTSTSFNIGLGDGGRLSSRVLRPPGGGHTDIFGSEPEKPSTRGQQNTASSAGIFGQEVPKPTISTELPSQNGAQTPQEQPAAEPALAEPAPASVPVSEPKQATVVPEPVKVEPPKRVRVPPGGFSSGLW